MQKTITFAGRLWSVLKESKTHYLAADTDGARFILPKATVEKNP